MEAEECVDATPVLAFHAKRRRTAQNTLPVGTCALGLPDWPPTPDIIGRRPQHPHASPRERLGMRSQPRGPAARVLTALLLPLPGFGMLGRL
jgi:hypothetical protein